MSNRVNRNVLHSGSDHSASLGRQLRTRDLDDDTTLGPAGLLANVVGTIHGVASRT